MDSIDILELFAKGEDLVGYYSPGEARGGKYYRRIPTGNPKRPWRYFYTKEEYAQKVGGAGHVAGQEALSDRQKKGPKRQWIGAQEAHEKHGLPEDTKKHHKAEGDYSQERKSLHEEIISKFLDHVQPAPEGTQKVAVLTMGGPASGKSSLLRLVLGKFNDLVSVNADDVKEELPEYKRAIELGTKEQPKSARNAAAMVHEESSDVSEEIERRAIAQGKSLVIDGTGKNPDKYEKKIAELKAKGYHVRLLMPHVPLGEALKRVGERAEKTGRYVPDSVSIDAHRKIPANFERIARLADDFALFRSKTPPEVIWSGGKGREDKIHNQKEHEAFQHAARAISGDVGAEGRHGEMYKKSESEDAPSSKPHYDLDEMVTHITSGWNPHSHREGRAHASSHANWEGDQRPDDGVVDMIPEYEDELREHLKHLDGRVAKSDAIDSLESLAKGVAGATSASHKYISRKRNASGGYDYVYKHPVSGDRVTIETSLRKNPDGPEIVTREAGGPSHHRGIAFPGKGGLQITTHSAMDEHHSALHTAAMKDTSRRKKTIKKLSHKADDDAPKRGSSGSSDRGAPWGSGPSDRDDSPYMVKEAKDASKTARTTGREGDHREAQRAHEAAARVRIHPEDQHYHTQMAGMHRMEADRLKEKREGNEGAMRKKSMDAIDGLESLSKAASHKYLSRKPDGQGGWTYTYSHDGERVERPAMLHDAHAHVAHAMHALGEKHGANVSVHVASHDSRRPEDEAGKYHTITIKDARGNTNSTWGGHPHGVTPSTMSQHSPAYESRDAIRAFEKKLRASGKQHGKAPKVKESAKKSTDAIDDLESLSKAASHKYISKKPNGRGGFDYIYKHPVSGKDVAVSTHMDKDENAASNQPFLASSHVKEIHEHARQDTAFYEREHGLRDREKSPLAREHTYNAQDAWDAKHGNTLRYHSERLAQFWNPKRLGIGVPHKSGRKGVLGVGYVPPRPGNPEEVKEAKKQGLSVDEFRKKHIGYDPERVNRMWREHGWEKSDAAQRAEEKIMGDELTKGLYNFAGRIGDGPGTIPDEYLYDYLCAFVEEAYEHERRESEHQNQLVPPASTGEKIEDHYARAILHELVSMMGSNPNLKRAASKHSVTKDVIASILRDKGLVRPFSDAGTWTDDYDSLAAMGGQGVTRPLMLSEDGRRKYRDVTPDIFGAPVGVPLVKAEPPLDGPLYVDDTADPHEALAKAEEHRLFAATVRQQSEWQPNVSPTCMIHGSADLTKSMNLSNPHARCTCPR